MKRCFEPSGLRPFQKSTKKVVFHCVKVEAWISLMTAQIAHFSDAHLLSLTGASASQFLNKRWTGGLNVLFNRGKHYQLAIFKALCKTVAELSPTHSVCTGDLVNLAFQSEFDLITPLMAQYFSANSLSIIPGNHDRYVKEALGRFEAQFAPYLHHDLEGRNDASNACDEDEMPWARTTVACNVPSKSGDIVSTACDACLNAIETASNACDENANLREAASNASNTCPPASDDASHASDASSKIGDDASHASDVPSKTGDDASHASNALSKGGQSALDELYPTVTLCDDLAIIGLCTARPRPVFFADGLIGQAQLERLRSILTSPKVMGRTIILALHHPPLDCGIRQFDRGLHDPDQLQELLITLPPNCRPCAILSGHDHKFNIDHCTGIPVLQCDSASDDRHAGFNIYHFDNRHLTAVDRYVWKDDQFVLAKTYPMEG